MTHVVTESCIRCRYTDCVDVCPVDCFRVGPNFLAIDPDECIDCAVCVAECPVNAIFAEEDVVQKIHGGKPTKSYNCNATHGLSTLHTGFRMTWKGWTVVSNREGRERFDLIGRNWHETEPANIRS